MKKMLAALTCALLITFASLAFQCVRAEDKPGAAAGSLSHCVYFSLNDASPEGKKKFVDSCKKHLVQHEGLKSFAVGTLCDEQKGEFNDRDFDIVINMVFANHEALHKYIKSPAHDEFLVECKPNFKKVRVFDADVDVVPVPVNGK